MPWRLEIPAAYRYTGYTQYRTFHPTFLHELMFDVALAAALVWLGHHRHIRPPGLFALHATVTQRSAFSRSRCGSTRRSTSSVCA